MKVLQVCAYGAEYPGNFIASLEELEKVLKAKGIETIYAFVEKASNKDWCREIQKRCKVYFLPEAKARILPKTYEIFRRIYRENCVSIVHSHFELYDMPATLMAPKETKVFWHLHDPIRIEKGLRGVLWKIQYGWVGRRAVLLAVAAHYRDVVVNLGFPKKNTRVILNGIDLSRIDYIHNEQNKIYDFLTFGWDFFRKGDDIILQACERLQKEGYRFKLLLNGNDQTWVRLREYLGAEELPEYLVKGEPTENVNKLFEQSRVFIQASRKETFSYAVGEAVYAGLPVICSDIPGLEWAHNLPAVSFFEPENVKLLYRLMQASLDEGWQVNIGENRRIVQDNYSLEIWAEEVFKSYLIET